MKAVQVERVRPRFYDRKGGDKETRRRAFNRNLDYLLQDEFLVKGKAGSEELLWLASKTAEAAGQLPDTATDD